MPARLHKVIIARKVSDVNGPGVIYTRCVNLPGIPGRDDIVAAASPHGRFHTVLHRRMQAGDPAVYAVVKPDHTHYRKREQPFAEICEAYAQAGWTPAANWRELFDDSE